MELKRKVTDTYSNKDFDYDQKLNSYINESPYLPLEKMENFPKYIPRQSLTKFLTRFKLFEMTKNIPGSIIECGVALGGGLMAFAQFSAILEPNNLSRKIIGFDTFDGFHSIDNIDRNQNNPSLFDELNYPDSEKDIRKSIELFDKNRFISHIPKVELVRGDATELIPQYLKNHPYLVISLMYLDVNLYLPTKTALELIYERMPKGAIIGFDELNDPRCPGETQAVLDTIGLNKLKCRRFDFDPRISWAEIE